MFLLLVVFLILSFSISCKNCKKAEPTSKYRGPIENMIKCHDQVSSTCSLPAIFIFKVYYWRFVIKSNPRATNFYTSFFFFFAFASSNLESNFLKLSLGDSSEKRPRRLLRWFWDFLKEDEVFLPVFLLKGFILNCFSKCDLHFQPGLIC